MIPVITIILKLKTTFMLWHCHYDKAIIRVHPVHLMNVEQYQAALDSQTKPTNVGCEYAATVYTHHCYLVLLSLKADSLLILPCGGLCRFSDSLYKSNFQPIKYV